MLETAALAFVTLFVTIGPIENTAFFSLLTGGVRAAQRPSLAARSVTIAGITLLLFAFGGQQLLGLLQITFPAFRFAGGLLLLLQAIDLVLVHRSGISSITVSEEFEAEVASDVAVFPLAIPLIAGPGSMTAIILLIGDPRADPVRALVTILMLIAVLALTFLAFRLVDPIQHLLGVTGTNVVARISGIILAALAVQFLFDAIRSAHLLAP